VAVVGVPDIRWGETPVATVTLQEGAEATAEELIAYTRDRLAHFKCPTRIEFVSELPRTATGKVLKTVLRQQHGGGEQAVGR
jgi:fatty-acyl-CoA synthase